MLVITERLPQACRSDADLLLSFELRSKTRLRTRTVDGEEAGLFLSAGAPLAHGQCLQAEDGRVVRILAADEPLLHVRCASPEALCRAAYHLGNRHVHLQVGEGWLRLLDDYVLEQMLQQMGAEVSRLFAPFNPESGAYGGGHHHSHGKDAAFQYAPKLHLFGQPA
ncbi:urease accessory protein UreE [Aquitalea magnusonii]|nr:urease accessory protein UreE [Aquitalea magnusonii]